MKLLFGDFWFVGISWVVFGVGEYIDVFVVGGNLYLVRLFIVFKMVKFILE